MNVLLFHERVLYDTIMYIDITNMYIRGVFLNIFNKTFDNNIMRIPMERIKNR